MITFTFVRILLYRLGLEVLRRLAVAEVAVPFKSTGELVVARHST